MNADHNQCNAHHTFYNIHLLILNFTHNRITNSRNTKLKLHLIILIIFTASHAALAKHFFFHKSFSYLDLI